MNTHIVTGQEAVMYYGKQICPDFNLTDPERERKYREIFNYLQGNKESIYDIKRSLLVTGNIGVGKSVLFRTMNLVFRGTPSAYVQAHARLDIERHLKEFGELETINKYGYLLKRNLLIDDIGTDDVESFEYKNVVRIVSDILLERDELYRNEGYKTHLISNLMTNALEDRYGPRIFDRLKGSTSTVKWIGESLRPNSGKS